MAEYPEYGTVGLMHGNRGPFTYRCPQDLYENLDEGDYVVVENRFGYTCGEVIEVHDEKQDTDPNIPRYRWAFQKVDEEAAEALSNLDGG